jgi:hypothetical protein
MFYGVADLHHTRTCRGSSCLEIRQRWQGKSVRAAGSRVSRRSVAGTAGVSIMVRRCHGSPAQAAERLTTTVTRQQITPFTTDPLGDAKIIIECLLSAGEATQ